MTIQNVKILTLDLGQSTGFAHADVNEHDFNYHYGIHSSHGLVDATRHVNFYAFLQGQLPLDTIVYEFIQHQHKSTRAAQIYWGLVAILEFFAEEKLIKTVRINTKTIKKQFTGNGNASKELVTQFVNDLYGLELNYKKEHDIADALAILDISVRES